MEISDAQRDLSRAYVGGGPGVAISGIIWLVATATYHFRGVGAGFAALFFGGMLIFPISKFVCRTMFRRENELPGNPFGMTALESTIAMIGGLFAAWLFLQTNPALVFPLAAIAVGTHYLVFKTSYGDRSFWLLGSIIVLIGLGDVFVSQIRGSTPLLVSITELSVGIALTARAKSSTRTSCLPQPTDAGPFSDHSSDYRFRSDRN